MSTAADKPLRVVNLPHGDPRPHPKHSDADQWRQVVYEEKTYNVIGPVFLESMLNGGHIALAIPALLFQTLYVVLDAGTERICVDARAVTPVGAPAKPGRT